MIITEQKSFDNILKAVAESKKIFLAGCASCATACKTGGEDELLRMKGRLEAEGKEIIGWMVIDTPCNTASVKKSFALRRKEVKEAEAVLVFSCGGGVQSIKENSRVNVPVSAGCNTLFLGSIGTGGEFYEECSMCGECVLDNTGSICPVTRCSKGLLNGPCGGAKEGKCEADRERDCAWILIYKELAGKDALHKMKTSYPPKDYSKMSKPRKRKLEIEKTNIENKKETVKV